jgi:two-component system chemotaxis response regulator CheB
MRRIRVLIVEDSLTVRKYLLSVLSADPEVQVVAEAGDGKQAIELCTEHKPDVITMDMMLPVMTGLSATEYIMAYCPTPILVVSSSVNRGELFRTYDALAAGAVDVLEKPTGAGPEEAWERRFLATVKLVSRISVITHPRARLLPHQQARRAREQSTIENAVPHRRRVVAIGASTGGPAAIVEVLRTLPASFELPILLVLHLHELFGTAFADWLDAQLTLGVVYARGGESLAGMRGKVIMAPAGRHLIVRNGKLALTMDAERHFCRPSVDVLFESVATDYGSSAIACLLTGMGRDGASGLLKIRQAGGLTIAQNEATSIVYGMPREAALLGAATQVLPLQEIGTAVVAAAGERA